MAGPTVQSSFFVVIANDSRCGCYYRHFVFRQASQTSQSADTQCDNLMVLTITS